MTYEEKRQSLLAKFGEQLSRMTSCENCPYNEHGVVARGWRDGADHLAGPCGQQNCWLDLGKK